MNSWRCGACHASNPAGTAFCGHCGVARRDDGSDGESEHLHQPAERRLVTVLVADLSGFTSLADQTDPEAVADIVDPVLQDLAAVVTRHGGFVDKFAGDAVMALFGAPRAQGQDADRALRAALEMHELVAALDFGTVDLPLHIGVNSGHVVARTLQAQGRRDYSVVGDAANVAHRLQSLARSGETLVGDSTRELLWGSFTLEDAGRLRLKGKREPVQTWRLLASAPAGHVAAATPMVGRSSELTSALVALREAESGSRPVVVVEGEAGAGKSRLVAELATRTRDRGGRWVQLRGRPELADVAYGALVEVLQSQTDPDGSASAADARGLIEDDGGDLAPEARQRRIHEAAARWLGTPGTVLAIDDAHWLDASTAALVTDAHHAEPGPGAVLVAGRSRGPLTAWLQDLTSVTAIALGPLDTEAVAELSHQLLGGPAPPALLDVVAERGQGNPFYVSELIRELVAARTLHGDDGEWVLDADQLAGTVPSTVEVVIAARIDRLSPAAIDVLRAASVLGVSGPSPVLEGMVDEGLDAGLAIKELVSDHVLRVDAEAGEVEFCHPLVQEVVYRRLLQRVRRRLHRAAAEAITSTVGLIDDTVDALARHHRLAGDADVAVPLLTRAARRAARLFSNREAIEQLGHAIELTDDRPTLAALLVELADLHNLVGDYDAAASHYERALGLDAGVDAWAGLAATFRRQGRYGDALELLDRAAEAVDADGDRRRLWLERSWACSFTDDLSAAMDAAAAGLAVDDGRDDAVTGHLRTRLAYALTELGMAERAVSEAAAAVEVFEASGDLDGRANALLTLGGALEASGELDRAAAALAEGVEVAERTGGVENLGGCLLNLGLVELQRGRLAEGIECDRRALTAFSAVGHQSGEVQAATNLAEKLLLVDEIDEARAHCERARDLAGEIGFTLLVAANLETLAQITLAQGDAVAAAGLAEESARLHLDDGFALMARKAWQTAATAWSTAGDSARAGEASRQADAAEEQTALS